MGQRFPLVPDLTAGEVPEKVEDAIEVVSGNLFPSMVHTMFQVESRGFEDVDEVLRANTQLFRFLHGIDERGSGWPAWSRTASPACGASRSCSADATSPARGATPRPSKPSPRAS